MKQVSAFALGLVVLVSCGRASNLEPSDDLGSGGADSSSQTGGSTASGGNSSGGATGSSAAGGEAALGGIGGEDGLPLCEPWGYPAPTVTQRLTLSGGSYQEVVDDGQYFYEGLVLTGPVDEFDVTFEGPEPDAWFQIQAEFPRPGQVVNPPLLHQLFTEGEELHMKFHLTDYLPLFAELRRTDGSLLAFIYTGTFHQDVVASLDPPIEWDLERRCRYEETDFDRFESLNLCTKVGATAIELSSYEEQEIEIEGRPFMLTVHSAINVGRPCSECLVEGIYEGENLNAQLIALD